MNSFILNAESQKYAEFAEKNKTVTTFFNEKRSRADGPLKGCACR
jgi:hypothetical protein